MRGRWLRRVQPGSSAAFVGLGGIDRGGIGQILSPSAVVCQSGSWTFRLPAGGCLARICTGSTENTDSEGRGVLVRKSVKFPCYQFDPCETAARGNPDGPARI